MTKTTANDGPIAILTAGAGGMICGSCLNDNTLAASLTRLGVDVRLIPTYTPIRTDTTDVSEPQVLMGGINVYLQQVLPGWGRLPSIMTRWLDNPQLIRWITSRHMTTDAKSLGPLTVSMLKGIEGRQRAEMRRVSRWLAEELQPRLVQLSNMLIAGFVPDFKQRTQTPVLITLQGDDIFLRSLPDKYRAAALEQIRRIDPYVDGYIVHSQYYADAMSDFLGLSRDKMHQVNLGVTIADFQRPEPADPDAARPFTLGYLSR
ncbi:MAG: hexosyltransferase, partial [Planctomycetales bacterium]|nr:hexosyltransferase [Planctomycetales bacterium]